ncbi:MAG: hypothetical protein ACRDY4_11180, partial [Acidimicrobiia bacterium]
MRLTPQSRTADETARLPAALAGFVAAGVALGITELLSGINRRVPPLIVAVGDLVVDWAPRIVIESGIAGLGARSKATLLLGIVTVSLVVGALLGALAARRPWPAVVGFSTFGLFGALAGARDPQALAVLGFASALLAVEAGIGTFIGVLRVRRPGPQLDGAALP